MERIKTIAFRGGNDLIANLQLCIDRISYTIPDVMNRIDRKSTRLNSSHRT